MNEDDMNKFLSENREAFFDAARKAVLDKVAESMKWSMPDIVHQTVVTFLKDEIAPEVSKILTEQRGAIIEAARKSAIALSDTLAEKMMESVTKNLDAYRAEKVFKALLGVDSRY